MASSPFVEAFVPQQRTHHGLVFPRIFTPSAHHTDLAALVQDIKENSLWFEEQLRQHSAILFRGFCVQSAADFDAVLQAFGWEPMTYHGLATRNKVLNGIYTANEGPAEAGIHFHHEMAQAQNFPSKLVFFCQTEPKEAGETPIVLSDRVVEKIQRQFPDFIQSLEKLGLRFTLRLKSYDDPSSVIGKGWQAFLGTKDEREAEKGAASYGARIEWELDKTAKFIQGPVRATKTFGEGGRKAWFNSMTGVYKAGSDDVTYGDGSALPEAAVRGCNSIMEEEAVDIPWRQGDIMVLDNQAVMHGKRPAKPPRLILVAMYK